MTNKQAKELLPGDCLTAIFSGEKDETEYPVEPGDIVIFERVMPKVRVVKFGGAIYKDGSEEMIVGRRVTGERVWLNFCNAKLFSEPTKRSKNPSNNPQN